MALPIALAVVAGVGLVGSLVGAGVAYVTNKQNNELAEKMMKQMQDRDTQYMKMAQQMQGNMYQSMQYPQMPPGAYQQPSQGVPMYQNPNMGIYAPPQQ